MHRNLQFKFLQPPACGEVIIPITKLPSIVPLNDNLFCESTFSIFFASFYTFMRDTFLSSNLQMRHPAWKRVLLILLIPAGCSIFLYLRKKGKTKLHGTACFETRLRPAEAEVRLCSIGVEKAPVPISRTSPCEALAAAHSSLVWVPNSPWSGFREACTVRVI